MNKIHYHSPSKYRRKALLLIDHSTVESWRDFEAFRWNIWERTSICSVYYRREEFTEISMPRRCLKGAIVCATSVSNFLALRELLQTAEYSAFYRFWLSFVHGNAFLAARLRISLVEHCNLSSHCSSAPRPSNWL